jgi:2-dehydro-3-deoxygluconokinase
MTRVAVIGECMVELRRQPDGSYARAFAGDAYNAAVHLKRSAPNIDVLFVSATGVDGLSDDMRQAWSAEGIDDSAAVAIGGLSPGLYMIETNAAGERSFSYWRGQSAARRWLWTLRTDLIAGVDLVFLTGIGLAILPPDDRLSALDAIERLQPRAFAFDPNVRPALWESEAAMRDVTTAAMARATILLPSQDDLASLWGQQTPEAHLARCQALGARETALTLGSQGCLVGEGEGAVRLEGPVGPVIDTSGAGDAFDGAYLAARLAGASPTDAARKGLALAARVVSLPGALPNLRPLA